MSDLLINVENVTKIFRQRSAGAGSLKSRVLAFRNRFSKPVLTALDNISFQVAAGETLGIIGANGAGKSTLLSLITGTMAPTSGAITTYGTISSLLELGAGFHPDLTGRENVFLCGAIMGLSRKQMAERFESIVSFAGIEAFIDQPVKHYSSGMYVRLGFAVAVEVDPDILLIDEVLAVGDGAFQRKCIHKMNEFREQGKTMLIISHDLHTIQSISDRILLLDSGKIIGLGDPENMVEEYESLTRQRGAKAMQREWGTGEVKITDVQFRNNRGEVGDKFRWGESLTAEISYNAEQRIENPVFGFAIADERGNLIYGNNTQIEKADVPVIEGHGVICLTIKELRMAAGNYLFSVSAHSADHKQNYHRLDNAFAIAIESDKQFEGGCYMPISWATGGAGGV